MTKEIHITVWTKERGQEDFTYDDWTTNFKKWWYSSTLHREDGPAVTDEFGYQQWRIDGHLHRVDGPAVENPHDNLVEWWIYGNQLSGGEVEKWIKENNIDLTTKDGQTTFILRWS